MNESKKGAVVRLAKGKGYRGPDYAGCCNTGRAVVIMHSRLGMYIVGPELAVDEARNMVCFFANEGKRVLKTSSGKAYVFKGGSSAWAKFHSLNDVVVAYNVKTVAKVNELRSRARRGDLAAAHELADY